MVVRHRSSPVWWIAGQEGITSCRFEVKRVFVMGILPRIGRVPSMFSPSIPGNDRSRASLDAQRKGASHILFFLRLLSLICTKRDIRICHRRQVSVAPRSRSWSLSWYAEDLRARSSARTHAHIEQRTLGSENASYRRLVLGGLLQSQT